MGVTLARGTDIDDARAPRARRRRRHHDPSGTMTPMNESEGYVVYFFPQALEALGDAIKPYLREGPGGEHVLCHEIDTAGALLEMTHRSAVTHDGRTVALELMVPQSMVKMVVSARSEAGFGFSPRVAPALMASLPPVSAKRAARATAPHASGAAKTGEGHADERREAHEPAAAKAQATSSRCQSRPSNASSGRKRRL